MPTCKTSYRPRSLFLWYSGTQKLRYSCVLVLVCLNTLKYGLILQLIVIILIIIVILLFVDETFLLLRCLPFIYSIFPFYVALCFPLTFYFFTHNCTTLIYERKCIWKQIISHINLTKPTTSRKGWECNPIGQFPLLYPFPVFL